MFSTFETVIMFGWLATWLSEYEVHPAISIKLSCRE